VELAWESSLLLPAGSQVIKITQIQAAGAKAEKYPVLHLALPLLGKQTYGEKLTHF
jgi:hypothetical protein